MRISRRWLSTFCLLMSMAGIVGAATNSDSDAAGIGEILTVATVKIASGPHAGTHVMRSDEACTWGPVHKGDPDSLRVSLESLTVAQSDLHMFPNEIGTIWLDARDVKASQNVGTFTFAISFGDPGVKEKRGKRLPGAEYWIDTRPDAALGALELMARGKGKLHGKGGGRLVRRGKSATFEFWAQTDQGVRLDGTIECRRLEPSVPWQSRR